MRQGGAGSPDNLARRPSPRVPSTLSGPLSDSARATRLLPIRFVAIAQAPANALRPEGDRGAVRRRPRISFIGVVGVLFATYCAYSLLISRAIVRRGDGHTAAPIKVVGITAHGEGPNDRLLHTGIEQGLRLTGGTTIVVRYLDMPSFAAAVRATGPKERSIAELHFYGHVDRFGQATAKAIRERTDAPTIEALKALRPLLGPGALVHVHNCYIGSDEGVLKTLAEVLGVPVRAGTGDTIAAGEEGTPLFEINTGRSVECTAIACR